jgi:hypothetical protein
LRIAYGSFVPCQDINCTQIGRSDQGQNGIPIRMEDMIWSGNDGTLGGPSQPQTGPKRRPRYISRNRESASDHRSHLAHASLYRTEYADHSAAVGIDFQREEIRTQHRLQGTNSPLDITRVSMPTDSSLSASSENRPAMLTMPTTINI